VNGNLLPGGGDEAHAHQTPKKRHHMPHQIISPPPRHLPSQLTLIVIIPTRQPFTEINILITDRRIPLLLQRLFRGPDLAPQLLLPLRMLHDNLPTPLLEKQRALFHMRVQFPVDEDAGVDVGLRPLAEYFVLGHDALVDEVEAVEFLARGVPVLPYFVVHDGFVGAGGHEFLHEHEVWAVQTLAQFMYDLG
jgi:hypothetical protein